VGERLPIATSPDRSESEIVGVIHDIQPRARGEEPRPEVYFAAWQVPEGFRSSEPMLVVRTPADPGALVPDLRQGVAAADDRIVLDNVMAM
jgi:hypothetical protein